MHIVNYNYAKIPQNIVTAILFVENLLLHPDLKPDFTAYYESEIFLGILELLEKIATA